MALRFETGQTFPSVALVDDRGNDVTIQDVADGRPLILVFYRGPW